MFSPITAWCPSSSLPSHFSLSVPVPRRREVPSAWYEAEGLPLRSSCLTEPRQSHFWMFGQPETEVQGHPLLICELRLTWPIRDLV